MWVDVGRCWEMLADVGSVGRCGEVWGGVGRCGEMWGERGPSRAREGRRSARSVGVSDKTRDTRVKEVSLSDAGRPTAAKRFTPASRRRRSSAPLPPRSPSGPEEYADVRAGRRVLCSVFRAPREHEGCEDIEYSGIRPNAAECVSSRALVGRHGHVFCG